MKISKLAQDVAPGDTLVWSEEIYPKEKVVQIIDLDANRLKFVFEQGGRRILLKTRPVWIWR